MDLVRAWYASNERHGISLRLQQKYEATIASQDDIGLEDSFPLECLEAMKGLWRDPSVQQTMRRGNEFALHDNIA